MATKKQDGANPFKPWGEHMKEDRAVKAVRKALGYKDEPAPSKEQRPAQSKKWTEK